MNWKRGKHFNTFSAAPIVDIRVDDDEDDIDDDVTNTSEPDDDDDGDDDDDDAANDVDDTANAVDDVVLDVADDTLVLVNLSSFLDVSVLVLFPSSSSSSRCISHGCLDMMLP